MSAVDVRCTALLVMEVQRGVVARLGDAGMLDRLSRAIGAARAAGLRVIHVTVGFRPGHPEVSARNRSFSALRDSGRFAAGDPAAEIHPAAAPQPGEVVVTKRRVGAFSGSDLDVVVSTAARFACQTRLCRPNPACAGCPWFLPVCPG